MNKKKFTLNGKQGVKRCPTAVEWMHRWNKVLAVFFGIFAFLLLIGFVLFTIIEITHETTDNHDGKLFTAGDEQRNNECKWVNVEKYQCNSVPVESIAGHLQSMINTPSTIELILSNCEFPDKLIPSKWMSNLTNISISSLTLQNGNNNFGGFNNDAFIANAFKDLTELKIDNGHIDVLHSGSFRGLSKLVKLYFNDVNIVSAEMNVLAPLSNSLEHLTIHHNSNPLRMENLTGSGTVPIAQIEQLDLRYNNYGDTLNNNSFSSLPKLISLYLSNCGINEFPESVLHPIINHIRLVHLDNNKLKTFPILPDSVFNRPYNVFKIYLAYNSLECSCPMSWRHQIYQYPNSFPDADKIQCQNSESFGKDPMDIECENVTIITTTELEIPTSSTLTIQPDTNEIRLTCDVYGSDNETVNFYVAKSQTIFTIEQKSETELKITVFEQNNKLTLIWFRELMNEEELITIPSDEPEVINCATNINYEIIISDIKPNIPYTICLFMAQSSIALTPLDCKGFATRTSTPPGHVWIPQDMKVAVIVSVVMGLLITIVISAIISFYTIRAHPEWLQANKRITIVHKSLSSTTSAGLSDYPNNSELNSCSTRSTSVNNTHYKLSRSASDASLTSNRSYVQAMGPTPLDLITWRMSMRQAHRNATRDLNPFRNGCSTDERPPPLPPHPNQEEDFYPPPSLYDTDATYAKINPYIAFDKVKGSN